LRESYITIIRFMIEDPEYHYQTALDLADFPDSFSVLLNDDVSCDSCDWIEFWKLPDGISCSQVPLSQRTHIIKFANPQNWNDI
jgi:hypothetical protein